MMREGGFRSGTAGWELAGEDLQDNYYLFQKRNDAMPSIHPSIQLRDGFDATIAGYLGVDSLQLAIIERVAEFRCCNYAVSESKSSDWIGDVEWDRATIKALEILAR